MMHMSNDLSFSFEDFPEFNNALSGNTALLLIAHKTNDDNYKSMAISLDSLAIQLRDKAIHARSAAYCNSSEFALVDHDHDIYTSATYSTKFHAGDTISTLLNIHDITHSNDYSLALSVIKSELTPDEYAQIQADLYDKRPKLGELRFIAASSLQTYHNMFDPTNAEFIGWIPANGAQYNINDFVLSDHMHLVFNTIAAGKFQVPSLNDFCKINDTVDNSSNAYLQHNGRNGLKQHNHSIGLIGDTSFNITAGTSDITYNQDDYLIPTTTDTFDNYRMKDGLVTGKAKSNLNGTTININGGIPYVHYGYKFKSNQIMSFTNNLASNAFQDAIVAINYDGDQSRTSYPSHNKMPSLIYVGYSKWSDYKDKEVIIA